MLRPCTATSYAGGISYAESHPFTTPQSRFEKKASMYAALSVR